MSTLLEQLNLDDSNRIRKFNDAHFEWLMVYEDQFTHAITLTFNPKRINYMLNKNRDDKFITKNELLDLQKKSFNCFANRLNKSLFGNASIRYGNKLLLIPILEGLMGDCRVHYHCVLGVPADRFNVIEEKVKNAWFHAPLTGSEVMVKAYRNSGWLAYSTKQAKFMNRECIDWGNVRFPSMQGASKLIAE